MYEKISIKDLEPDSVKTIVLASHFGGGYSKRLYVEINVITKEMTYFVEDKLAKFEVNSPDINSVIEVYNNILRQID